MMNGIWNFSEYVSKRTDIDSRVIRASFSLFSEGYTVPFIARYRGALVEHISADKLFTLQTYHTTYLNVERTRIGRLAKLSQRNLLNSKLKCSFDDCCTIEELDELWLPYKTEKKDSDLLKASSVIGLNDIALEICNPGCRKALGPLQLGLSEAYPDFSANQGLLVVLLHMIIVDISIRETARLFLQSNTLVTANLKKKMSKDERDRSNFKDYDGFSKRLHTIPNHTILALRRGKEDSDDLAVKIGVVSNAAVVALMHKLLEKFQVKKEKVDVIVDSSRYADFSRSFSASLSKHIVLDRDEILGECICEAVRSHLIKSLTNQLWRNSVKAVELEALEVFATNLHKILMIPPLKYFVPPGPCNICGIDPGQRNGHKIVVLDSSQSLIERLVIDYNKDPKAACAKLKQLYIRHNVRMCSIGDGVGCLEAQKMAGQVVQELRAEGYEGHGFCVVSEAGASVYSVSPTAREEFPNVEITYLGAISIAQRLRDPLSELVKIQPSSLGVGMYQKDLTEKAMNARLSEVVQKCVNEVGVDIFTSSLHLLKHVSGLSSNQAAAILECAKNGLIKNRNDLLTIKGFGPVTFKNCAGFLRISCGDTALDDTCVHPEQYDTVTRLLALVGFTDEVGMLRHSHLGSTLLRDCFISVRSWDGIQRSLGIDLETMLDLVGWLVFPNTFTRTDCLSLHGLSTFHQRRMCDIGIPPELKTAPPSSLRQAERIGEPLSVGKSLLGVVRNITTFGAFVDLGVEGRIFSRCNSSKMNTGLLHASLVDLGSLTIGQALSVTVKAIDEARGRISLALEGSMLPSGASGSSKRRFESETENKSSAGKKRTR
jgi:protein Tex